MSQAAALPASSEKERGSGRQQRIPEPRFLVTGKIVGAHGLRGELKVLILTDDPHRFGRLEQAFVGPENEIPQPWAICGSRLHTRYVLLQLEGCDDRATAESMRGWLVQVPLEEAIPLAEGEYFEHQVIGLDVWTTWGERLGDIVDIIYTGANEVYVVRGADSSEILIPAIESVVLEIDLGAGRLVVDLPDGLM